MVASRIIKDGGKLFLLLFITMVRSSKICQRSGKAIAKQFSPLRGVGLTLFAMLRPSSAKIKKYWILCGISTTWILESKAFSLSNRANETVQVCARLSEYFCLD